ncbi:hypothetical protein vseg_000955 [Gypsophila vaccaria]
MGELRETNITLQMADRTVKRPLGVLEDVPVKIGKHFISVDFVVLDIPEDTQIPIILGRPFLRTANDVIDLRKGNLTLTIGEEIVTFNLPTALRNPMVEETAFAIDILDETTAEIWDAALTVDPCDALMKFGVSVGRPLFFNAGNDEGALDEELEIRPEETISPDTHISRRSATQESSPATLLKDRGIG